MKVYVLYILIFFSCSIKQNAQEHLKIEIGSQEKINLKTSGVSSGVPFPFDYYSKDKILIFDKFNRSIDTLVYENLNFKLFKGNQLPSEGPSSVQHFNSFWVCDSSFYFIDSKTLILRNKTNGDNSIIHLKDLELFSSPGVVVIARGNGFNFNYPSYSCESGNIFLIVKNMTTGECGILKFNFRTHEYEMIQLNVDNEQLNKHTVSLPMGLSVINFPDVFLTKNKLIVSYVFKGDFHVYDIKTSRRSERIHKSDFVPSSKNLPREILPHYTNQQIIAVGQEWQDDISFGSFESLEQGYIFRLIRSKIDNGTSSLILELFDENLQKVHEENLTKIQSNLGYRWFVLKNEIIILSKEQPNEDELLYYKVNIKLS